MLRVSLCVSAFILLSGCATQFGTRISHPAPHQIQRAAPVVQAPVQSKKETFKNRWLHLFFRKRSLQ